MLLQTKNATTVLGVIPTELSLESIYFPPFLFTVMLGFLCAFGIHKLLNMTGLNRYFWHSGLVFVAIWIMSTSLIGLTVLPP